MAQKTIKSEINTSKFRPKIQQISSIEAERARDVERVLEHVSSPYRWELLEMPKIKKAKT